MSDALLHRLEDAVEKVIERNRQLTRECQQLKEEQSAWQQERSELLGEIEQVLARLDDLDLEDT